MSEGNRKKLKDPIYGYISIPSDLMDQVVDTAVFQRLRRITQTSYSPLFASAVHNRFVHSLGVYHLGGIAFCTLKHEIEEGIASNGAKIDWQDITLERLEEIFLLACLLHDVGHAPFSHTGERFYLDDGQDYETLHKMLKEAVNTDSFSQDVPAEKSNAAAPHEIMSAIVGIVEFGSLMQSNAEKEFFARCITGYGYSNAYEEQSIRNCFIQMLNSKIIDVDKLDYLIRDAYITGYYTVKIDYERLLTSLTMIKDASGTYSLAYHKGAISVIENVVYAHDSERKWIQTHPVILYENYILQHVMEFLEEKLSTGGKRLFSIESLSYGGQRLDNGTMIRLLSDDDIVYLMKQYTEENELIPEYFERRKRRHPLWKSEAEYKVRFFDFIKGGSLLDSLERAMEATAKYLSKNATNWVINEELGRILEKEISNLESAQLDQVTKEAQKKEKSDILKVFTCLTKYAQEVGYQGDFVLLKSSLFSSGFSKPDFSDLKIVFPAPVEPKIARFGEKVSSVSGILNERDNYFYLYCKCDTTQESRLNVDEICKRLFQEFFR